MEDIDHEGQWPSEFTELRQIESTLRCLICGDFLRGPVVLRCGHLYCSECIRKFLQSKGSNGCCPECKHKCVPSDLIAMRSVEKIAHLFQQMKPRMLHNLNGSAYENGDSICAHDINNEPPERIPLVSYSVMKDKEIKKLLDAININLPFKTRDEMINAHKEYVLLVNAQSDTSYPKTLAQCRDEVKKNYRLRQGIGFNRNGLTNGVSKDMKSKFQELKNDILRRKRGRQTNGETNSYNLPENKFTQKESGYWRHVSIIDSGQEYYIHTSTNEIRLERPPDFKEFEPMQNQIEELGKVSDVKQVLSPAKSENNTIDLSELSDSHSATKSANNSPISKITDNIEEETKWECPRCTLINSIMRGRCEACGHEVRKLPDRSARKRVKNNPILNQSKISL